MVVRIVRSFARQSSLTLGSGGTLGMIAATLLALACGTGIATAITWSLRSTEVARVHTNAAKLSVLADVGRVAVRDLLAASSGYIEPAAARSVVRQRWHKFQLSFTAFCTKPAPPVADAERLRSLCSNQPAFFERTIPQIMAFDPPTRLLDRALVQQIFAERDALAAAAAAAATRADALVERLRRNYRADQIVLATSSAGFAGACLCMLLLAGRAVRASGRHRRDAEEAHSLLLETIEAIPAGVVLFDRGERLMMFNTAAVRSSPLLGRPGIIGTTYEALARESEQLSAKYGGIAIGNAQDWLERFRSHERKMHQPIGERWFEWSDRLTRNGHTVSLRVDITDLKRRVLELEATRTEYEELLDALPEGVYKLDIRAGRFAYVNPAGARLLGLARRQVIGTALLDLVLDDDRAAVEAVGHGGSLAPGVASTRARFRIRTQGRVRRLEIRFTTMVGVLGAALVGTMREVESSSCS